MGRYEVETKWGRVVFCFGFVVLIFVSTVLAKSTQPSTPDGFITEIDRADDLLDANRYERALAIYDSLIESTSRRKFPYSIAQAQKGSADALLFLGDELDSVELIEDALGRYADALYLIDYQERAALWINTKIMHSRAYTAMAAFRDREKNLLLSARCLEEVVQSGNLDEYQSKKGTTYENLADAYLLLGKTKQAEVYTEKAIRFYRHKYRESDRTIDKSSLFGLLTLAELCSNMEYALGNNEPGSESLELLNQLDSIANPTDSVNYASFQFKRACILQTLGRVRMSVPLLERAVEGLELVCQYYSLLGERFSEARSYLHLANAYSALGNHSNLTENCINGIKSARHVCKIASTKDYPSTYYEALAEIGSCYASLAGVSDLSENADSALLYLNLALDYRVREGSSKSVAGLKSQIAGVHYLLGKLAGDHEHFAVAIQIGREANEIFTALGDKHNSSIQLGELGGAYTSLSYRENRLGNLKQALAVFEEGIRLAEEAGYTMGVASLKLNRGATEAALAKIEQPVENLNKAIATFEAAAQTFSKERFPGTWCLIMCNTGAAYMFLSQLTDSVNNSKLGIACYDSALTLMEQESDPIAMARLLCNRASLYWTLSLCEDREANLERTLTSLYSADSLAETNGLKYDSFVAKCRIGSIMKEMSQTDPTNTSIEKAVEYFERAYDSGAWASQSERSQLTLDLVESRLQLMSLTANPEGASGLLDLLEAVRASDAPAKNSETSAAICMLAGRIRIAMAQINDPEANFTYAIEELRGAIPFHCGAVKSVNCCDLQFELSVAYSQRGYLLNSLMDFKESLANVLLAIDCQGTNVLIQSRLSALNNAADCYMQIAKHEDKEANINIAISRFNQLAAMPELVQFPDLADLVKKNLAEAAEIKSGR